MGKENGLKKEQQEQTKKLSKEEYDRIKKSERKKKNKEKKKGQIEQKDLGNSNRGNHQEVIQTEQEPVEEAKVEVPSGGNIQFQIDEMDPDTLLTGKDYENFRTVFEAFKNHESRLMIKTYEKVDEKEKEAEEKEREAAEAKLAQDQVAQQQQQQNQYFMQYGHMPMTQYPIQPKKEQKLSKKQRKQLRWLKVSELKQRVKRPDLVEFWDITSTDPLFLVHLKSQRNTVSIPRHWSQKRKYLQNKRGVLKEPFKLPEYIDATGIARLRDPFVDRDGGKMVRQKLRERMNPKQGKLDIDYQTLHDAFFKYQTRPPLTKHGDIYFEGKEEELRARTFKPGRMSAELRAAVGVTDYQAPPWLPNMQRYGPPPSYPHMKFIGMSSVFTEAASYHTSVKQVIEDTCKKLDQPGLYATFKYIDDDDQNYLSTLTGLKEEGFIDKALWGRIEEVEEEDAMEEEPPIPQQQQSQYSYQQENELQTRASTQSSRSGISSIISGIETPDVDLRKATQQSLNNEAMKPLFQILEQVSNKDNKGIFGTGHSYLLPDQQKK